MENSKFERALRGSRVMNSDWSLSLGFTIHVLTDNVEAVAKHRRTREQLDEFIRETATPNHVGSSGVSLQFNDSRKYVIIVGSVEAGCRVTDGRMVEIIAHECSHVVDYIADVAALKLCTETRAYTLDWLVGKTAQVVLPHMWGSERLSYLGT